MDTFFKALTLSFRIEHDNDKWEFTEEPHINRRQAILQKHPEIKQLMGYEPMTAVYVSATVIGQIAMAALVTHYQPGWLPTLLLAYFVGGTLSHSLGGAIHEVGHNLAFGHKYGWANRWLSMVANLPLVVPMAVSYKKYHQHHHRLTGHSELDVDIPCALEVRLFRNPFTKFVWLLLFPALYSLRPFVISPKPLTYWELVNMAVQFVFDVLVFKALGMRGMGYLMLSVYLGLSIHPMVGHFISEHFLFANNQATHSYYGPFNYLFYNLGYHVEHHDFPYIPHSRIKRVREIAPEFYNHLPYHTSLTRVLLEFLWYDHMGPGSHSISDKNLSHPEIYDKMHFVPTCNETGATASCLTNQNGATTTNGHGLPSGVGRKRK